jgi:tetratricopeptide (TPR) repeat protein
VRHGISRCPDDLVVTSVRRPLSDIESQALAVHLGSCGACRAAAAMTGLLAETPADERRHAEMVSRLAVALAAKHGLPTRRLARGHQRWIRAAAVAVALALVSATAGAAAWITIAGARARRAAEITPRPLEPRAVVASTGARNRTPPPSGAPPAVAAGSEGAGAPASPAAGDLAPAAIEARPPPVRRRTPQTSRAPAAVPPPGAAHLFAGANALRRNGDTAEAIAAYRALEAAYPESEESCMAAISLGEILLRRGEPGAAEVQFSRYLGQRPSGPLAEEALFGRARALTRLGTAGEARGAWRELARRFPKSLYRAGEGGGARDDRDHDGAPRNGAPHAN